MPTRPENAPDSRLRILVIDDDRKLCRLIHDYLEPLGYDVTAAHTGPEGLEAALQEPFSAVILDVMLPGTNGFDVLRELRAKSAVPVLMLTGRGEEPDRIVGLELGADDYLPKTFSTRELLARLRAVVRRSALTQVIQDPRAPEVVVGDLHLDPEGRVAARGDQPLPLTAVEFDLLLALAKTAGRVRTRSNC
jgi:two-component system response regulator CpxR